MKTNTDIRMKEWCKSYYSLYRIWAPHNPTPPLIAVSQEFDLVSMSGWSQSVSQSVKIGCSLLQHFERRVRFDWHISGFVDILDSNLESDSCESNLSSSLCESAACITPACLRVPPSQSEHAPDSGFIRRGSEWSCSQTLWLFVEFT